MAVDERARHQLYQRLEAVLGAEEATILMAHLPPVGWADVATKRDLDLLEAAFRHDFETNRREHDRLHEDIERLGREIHQTRTLLIALFGTVVSMGGVAFAAAHLV
jgi:hypothetical protein